ncbi:hypothetical protein [Paenibacillus silvae]|uniref:Uncharacterized protein n=1 Tax=Paenibacillus silvae TaxID=1325358 RepID=A0A2W6NXG7_9BACL|nr:hypothetical protein [Paenibacillus silvae]PZT52080.1 hypothetical protein DN757_29210 [Paenibacillus silvae]
MFRNNSDFIDKIKEYTKELVEKNQMVYSQKDFEESFLMQSSHTPFNIDAIQKFEYGRVEREYSTDEYKGVYGLKVKNQAILLTDIMYFLEGEKNVLNLIENEFPELSISEIKAALRVMMIFLRSIECDEILGNE